MVPPKHCLPLIIPLLLFFSSLFFGRSSAFVGTAAYYDAPFAPTACFGNNVEPFPANDLFAAVDSSIWFGGAYCGKQFKVKCLSNGCTSDQIIQVKLMDHTTTLVSKPSSPDRTFVLSRKAFALLANPTVSRAINIEYQMVGTQSMTKESKNRTTIAN